MKSHLLVLFLSKTVFSICATQFPHGSDITKDLNDTIVRIFQIAEPQNRDKLILSLINSDPVTISTTPYTYNYTWQNGTEIEIRFYNLRLIHASANDSFVSYGFLNNEIQLHSSHLLVKLLGVWNVGNLNLNYDFNSNVRLSECTISAIRQPNNSVDSFLIDLKYSHMDIRNAGPAPQFSSFRKPFESVLPSILRTHMSRNKKFLDNLNEIHNNQLGKQIIVKHRQFHYLIPSVPIGSLNLRNIVVSGLSNFHSFNFTIKPNTIIYTLLMKDIRGSMILEEIPTDVSSTLELHYFIDSLSIFVTYETNRISVRAENYSMIETKSNTKLTDVQSNMIMDQFERAIASSIMPSMKFQELDRWSVSSNQNENEDFLRRSLIKKSFRPDENNIDHRHNTRILINDRHLSSESPQVVTNNYFTYNIKFSNLTIVNYISGNQPHLNQIQCPLLNHSQFSYQIRVDPSRKLFRNNDKVNLTDIKFNFSLSPLNVSIIENKTMINDSCEFEISNDEDIEICSFPSVESNATGSHNERLELKKTIDKTLISLAKERFVQTMKATVRSSFDICVQSAKIIEKFFRNFVDLAMEKFSLRRGAT